ncbi:AAA family ATPase [Intestinibaculum porci]|nr:AAA family ATPase [Intestinibaculum porci]
MNSQVSLCLYINEVSLYTRPRRFGKSMNMSMLYYFFSIKEKDNAHLFDHLKITAEKEAMKHQNRYPVINLSLKTMIDDTFELNLKSYQNLISNYLGTHLELLDLKNLDEYDRMRLKELREQRADVTLLKDSLRLLTECLYKYWVCTFSYGVGCTQLIPKY